MKKKFIYLLLLSPLYFLAITAYSQSPTKEQTIDFLNNYYKANTNNIFCVEHKNSKTSSTSFRVNSINKLDSCEYELSWNYDYKVLENGESFTRESFYKTKINFKKVENYSFTFYPSDICTIVLIKLKLIDNESVALFEATKPLFGIKTEEVRNVNYVEFPIGKQQHSGQITEPIEKVSKAFNHLRKLCGAPDPIKF